MMLITGGHICNRMGETKYALFIPKSDVVILKIMFSFKNRLKLASILINKWLLDRFLPLKFLKIIKMYLDQIQLLLKDTVNKEVNKRLTL